MDFDAFERANWPGRAEAYDRGFARLTAHTVEPLLNSTRVGPRTRLLDIGCGPGPVTAAALELGAQVTSADADLDMLEVVARRHPHTHVQLATLPELPFPDEEFDAVVGNYVINHTGNPPAAIEELYRVLRPGGRIALTCWRYPDMRANKVFSEAVQAAEVGQPDDVPAAQPFGVYAEPKAFAGLLGAAGFAGAGADTLRWEHTVDPGAWWDDVVAGTACNGAVINRQDPSTVAKIRAEYDRIIATFPVGEDGRVTLPACALLAHGTR
ncbi:class I SAM-dependent methyltransferase [Actinomadura barringtoniae]|uniref:Class I SAM-dependent methyltransferase n=1 Tax=Actinomadura barringtoniae TaxID=1427535 RepID=A0A939PBP6_9ACTN|nr:class I SAM-dependent methyltransferase [Actinomadura barringtoniae]MBO2449645.1 class I SAM-dependent methyltransferase [Actinomadura barringtoniae]